MEGEGVPAKQNTRIWNQILDAYAWMKSKLNPLFKVLTESIAKALQSITSFVMPCDKKLRGNLAIFTEMKLPAKGIVGLDDLLSAIGRSHEMKLDGLESMRLINLAEGLIKLLEYARQLSYLFMFKPIWYTAESTIW